MFKWVLQDWRTLRGIAYFRLGRIQRAQGHLHGALRSFSRVIALLPDEVAAYANRAICHYDLDQLEESWMDFRKAQELAERQRSDLGRDMRWMVAKLERLMILQARVNGKWNGLDS